MALRIVIDVLIAIGAIFALAGTIGLLKMPDTFCRMQASTCVSTLGMMGVMVGAGGAFDQPVEVDHGQAGESDRENKNILHFHILPIHFSILPLIASPAFSLSVSETSIQWM